jgi:hypothetical protein
MDAILFSANPTLVEVDDARRHLDQHDELYWEVGFRILRDKFSYPMLGFIHIKGGQVEYKVMIQDIIPFSREHYEDQNIAKRVKPEPWLTEWKMNINDIRNYPWKNALVMTSIEPFSYDTYQFLKCDGQPIKKPTQNYIRVLPPKQFATSSVQSQNIQAVTLNESLVLKTQRPRLTEVNLEEFVIHQLDEIEPGLVLESRQLHTDAGRLDLLCKDLDGRYVVIELKRSQGTDQVVGQILRYMGWIQENYRTDRVRGIIIVGKKDQALSYAIKAVKNIQLKEFKISIQ